ncbi:hypothetical protein AAFN85_19900 [Mucilaginibacter sp. CAU 1740]|jgi:hypothetical protein
MGLPENSTPVYRDVYGTLNTHPVTFIGFTPHLTKGVFSLSK